jgi:hypothetical protein
MATLFQIRKLTACLLLVLFCISMAPRAWFHDLLANHQDKPGCTLHHTRAVFHQQELNCHFDDIVVHVPFLRTPEPHFTRVATTSYYTYCNFYAFHIEEITGSQESRGPPSV